MTLKLCKIKRTKGENKLSLSLTHTHTEGRWDFLNCGPSAKLIREAHGPPAEDNYMRVLIVKEPFTPGPILIEPESLLL